MLSKQRTGGRPASRVLPEFGKDVEQLGYWSARLVMVLVSGLFFSLLLDLFGIATEPFGVLAFLLLAPTLIVTVVAIHYQARPDKRIWSELGIIFAVIFAVLVNGVHAVQLNWAPGTTWGSIGLFARDNGSVVFAVNMFAYAALCLSSGFLARAITVVEGAAAWIQRLFVLSGWLLFPMLLIPPFLAGTATSLIWVEGKAGVVVLLLWSMLFIPLSGLVCGHFHRLLVHRQCGVINIR